MEHNISEKFTSVIGLAKHWQDTMPKKPGKGDGTQLRDWEGLTILLTKFSTFAKEYETLLSKTPPIANPGFILNQGSERLLETFSIISRACEQRSGTPTEGSMVGYLAQAEDVLESYCRRWKPEITDDGPYLKLETPVVYFEKIYDITRALFEPQIPIVSIPLTEYNQPKHWQALAHELGHHIYWNTLANLNEVEGLHQKMLQAVEEKVRSGVWEYWLEEIFADICGTLLIGPEYLASCQNLAVEQVRKPDEFIEDDGEHPSLYLRPLISSHVLSQVIAINSNTKLQDLLDFLSERWRRFSATTISGLDKNSKGPGTLLTQELKSVVSAILESPIWPQGKRLLDLINFYNKTPLRAEEMELLEQLLGLDDFSPDPQGILPPTGPNDKDIPEALRELWKFLKQKLDNPNPLEKWNTLLELTLEESHAHFRKHTNLKKHTPWGRLHRHSRIGSETIWQ